MRQSVPRLELSGMGTMKSAVTGAADELTSASTSFSKWETVPGGKGYRDEAALKRGGVAEIIEEVDEEGVTVGGNSS